MRNFRFVLILAAIIYASACRRSEPSITIQYKNIGNLKKDDKVTLNGVLVGSVQGFHIVQDVILTDLFIQDGVKIPVDSRFVVHQSLLGRANISIEQSDKLSYISRGDTVLGESYKEPVMDSVKQRKAQAAIKKMAVGFAELIQVLSKDSISE